MSSNPNYRTNELTVYHESAETAKSDPPQNLKQFKYQTYSKNEHFKVIIEIKTFKNMSNNNTDLKRTK